MKVKRLTAILIAALMILTLLPVAAFADPIPVTTAGAPLQGSLTINKYLGSTGAIPGAPNDGTSTTPPDTNFTKQAGVVFDLYQVINQVDAGGHVIANFLDPNLTANNPSVLEAYMPVMPVVLYTAANGTGSITSGSLDASNPAPKSLIDAMGNIFNVAPASQTTATTLSNGQAVFNPLNLGVYLAVEEAGYSDSPCAPFLACVPMTNPNGDGWNTDVQVYPKNQDILTMKAENKPAVNVGDTVTYSIVVGVPDDIAGLSPDQISAAQSGYAINPTDYAFKAFNVTDQLDPALTFVPGSVTVTGVVAGTDPTVANLALTGTVLNAGTAPAYLGTVSSYTVTEPVTPPATGFGGGLLTVSFDKLAQLQAIAGYQYLQITFQATVNATALIYGTNGDPNGFKQSVPNTAKLNYQNYFDSTLKTKPTNTVWVHTANLEVTKIDEQTGNKLQGATFKLVAVPNTGNAANDLAAAKAAANAKSFVKLDSAAPVDANGNPTGNFSVLYPASSGLSQAASEATAYGAGKDYAVTTDSNGIAKFSGLQDYTTTPWFADMQQDDQIGGRTYLTYYIVETGAPSGYNLLTEPVPVTFSGNPDNYVTNLNTLMKTIADSSKFVLPKTGGMGTVLFTVGGIGLMGLACVLFLATKKRKNENAQ